MNYLQLSVQQLEVFEGKIPYMYLDPKGNVTVGVGLLLASAVLATALPFQMNGIGGSYPATSGEIASCWGRVKSMRSGFKASYYEWNGSVFLEAAAIDALLLQNVTGRDRRLRQMYPAFDSYPDAAKVALLDMDYNLGDGGLEGFHHMNASLALSPVPWAAVAAESARETTNPAFIDRNAWTAAQFKSCEAS